MITSILLLILFGALSYTVAHNAFLAACDGIKRIQEGFYSLGAWLCFASMFLWACTALFGYLFVLLAINLFILLFGA